MHLKLLSFFNKWHAKHSSLLVIVVGFTVFYLIFDKQWMLIPIAICFIGFLIDRVGEFIHLLWMMLAKILGYINSRILLTIIFFVILTPIALLMRLLGKTTFVSKLPRQRSLFITRNHLFSRQDLEQPF